MMGDVAKGLKSFKQGMSDDDKPEERRDPRSLPRSSDHPIDVTPEARRAEGERRPGARRVQPLRERTIHAFSGRRLAEKGRGTEPGTAQPFF